MANPPIQDRVSPSGPFSGEAGPDGGLTPPGLQIAGDHYLADQDPDGVFVAKLLPYNTNVPYVMVYNSDGPVPTVTPAGSLLPMDPMADSQPLTAGTWLVQLHLEGGFITSFPLSDDNWGALKVEMEFSALDGSGAKTATQENLALPYAYFKTVGEFTGVLGKTTVSFPLEISEAEAAAGDGFPVRRFKLSRTDAPNWTGPMGAVRYTDTSGIYELHKTSMFSVVRVR